MRMSFSKSWKCWEVICLVLLSTLAILSLSGAAQSQSTIVPGHFHFKTFTVPNQSQLAVEQINYGGLIVGYFTSTTGPVRGYERFPNGNLQTLIDPLDVEGPGGHDPFIPGETYAEGVNDQGVIVGQFWDSTTLQYAGFFLYKGKYTTYNVPNYFNTSVIGINDDVTDFCGSVQTSSSFTSPIEAFVSDGGTVTVFTVPNAIQTQAVAINNFDQVLGYYEDANNVFHGFIRDRQGNLIYPIDPPGASTTAFKGTVPLGLNDFGFISGHFWDSSNKEHGFVRAPWGQFFQIDFPGAKLTSGGGLNDFGTVVGHWNDQNGNQLGYIATPSFGDD